MNLQVNRIISFLAGALLSACFLYFKPISDDEVMLKGVMSFAGTLEGYGYDPVFDPRQCTVTPGDDEAARSLGAYLYFYCTTETVSGAFYMDVGYSTSGAVADGSHGLMRDQ